MERRSFLGRFGVGAAGLLVPPAVLAGEPPPSSVRVTVLTTFVAGFQYHAGRLPAVAATLRPGRMLVLRPEPGNPHDDDAVAVTVGEMGARIGYIPRRDNRVIAELLRGGALVMAVVMAFDPSAPSWERVEMRVFVDAVAAPVPAEPFAWQPTGLVVPVETSRRHALPDDLLVVDFEPTGDEELDLLILEAEIEAARREAASGEEVFPGFVMTPEQEAAERAVRKAERTNAPRPKRPKRTLEGMLDGAYDVADRMQRSVNRAGRVAEAAVDGLEAIPRATGYAVRHVAGQAAGRVEVTVQGVGEQAWEIVRTVERHANVRSRQTNAVVNEVLDVLG